MENQDFSITMMVNQSPAAVFKTLINVRAWWSGLHDESFEGKSESVGDVFSFIAGSGAHFTRQKMVEFVPNKRVSWLVTEANLTFVGKPDEWVGTRICFDLAEEGGKTKIIFTHQGLVPDFECYESCASAWTKYLGERLHAALGQTNESLGKTIMYSIPILFALLFAVSSQALTKDNQSVPLNKEIKMTTSDFTTSFLVDQTPEEVFKAINNVRGWWSESIEGNTNKLNEQFLYYYKDVHISKMKIVEFVPGERVVWEVFENRFNFTKDPTE